MLTWLARLVQTVLGMKVFATGVLMTVLAVILYNLVVDIIEEVMNFAVTQMSGASLGTIGTPSLVGFAAWFVAQCKIPECISVITAAVALRFVLRKIPFLRW